MVFGWLFRHKPQPPTSLRRGPLSHFVLLKLGYDMRQDYQETIEQPLPEPMRGALSQLPTRPTLHLVQKADADESRDG